MGLQKNDNYYNITNWFFIIAILIFSITSLFHVTVFWLITNSLFLSIIMSVATGFGIISSLLSTKYTKLTYISFALIILIELFGNIYGSFIHIDVTSKYFLGWKELMEPIFSFFYTMEEGVAIPDVIYKRWAAIIQGSFIPLLLSITFHMWMVVRDKYLMSLKKNEGSKEEPYLEGADNISELPFQEEYFIGNTNNSKTEIESLNELPISFTGSTVEDFNNLIEDLINPLENDQINEKEETNIQKEEIVQSENKDAKIKPQATKEEVPDKKIESKPKSPGKGKMIKVKDKEIGNIYLKPENDK